MSVLAAIREATGAAHEELETGLDVLSRLGTLDGRRRLLADFHALYEPAEGALAPRLAAVPGLAYAERLKLPLLLDDLRALGGQTPAPAEAPRLRELPHALGFAYVLEGATLGGRVIRKRVAAAGQSFTGLSFFDAYGPAAGRRWMDFCEVLERECTASPSEALLGAKEGFAYMTAGLLQAA